MSNSIIISNCTILIEATAPLIHDGFARIMGEKITEIGPMEQYRRQENETVIDGRGQLLMPGLINCHTHAAMSLFRGMADDLELTTWLNDHIFPAEAANVSKEMVRNCSKLSAAEMIMSGTTCVADAYFYGSEASRSFAEAGLRAVVAHGVIDFPAPGIPDPSKNVETVATFIDRHQGTDPLITPGVFAHAPYTCSPETLTRAKALADDRGVPFFLHLAETQHELTMIDKPLAKTPVQHLAALGLLNENCICVHCTWLDDLDLDIIAEKGAHVVSCPQSNLKLAAGIARVNDMVQRGIRVGIGTDGCASNNSLDLFREMSMLAKVQKTATMDATTLPAARALQCATSDGAHLLGLSGLGKLAPGTRADCILIDLQAPHLTPFYNQDLLVYGARGADVTTSIINGQLVMRNRRILNFDLQETMDKVTQLAQGVRKNSGKK